MEGGFRVPQQQTELDVSGKKNGFIDAVVSILKNLEQAVSRLVETGLGDQEVAAWVSVKPRTVM